MLRVYTRTLHPGLSLGSRAILVEFYLEMILLLESQIKP